MINRSVKNQKKKRNKKRKRKEKHQKTTAMFNLGNKIVLQYEVLRKHLPVTAENNAK